MLRLFPSQRRASPGLCKTSARHEITHTQFAVHVVHVVHVQRAGGRAEHGFSYCSPLSRFPGYAWSEVGRQAVLPCSCRTYVSPTAQAPYILWQTVSHTVFERMGKDSVQGESYENRADVPMEMLAEGNCSLILSDVRFRDAGIYESYLVVGQSRVKNQILIHSVRLAVVDHKHIQSVESGKDLILDLYTNQAKMLVFQQEGTPEWRVLWQRGQDSGGERWVEERGRKLVVREVVTSNSGTYRVVDEEGLTLSTVKVSVTGKARHKQLVYTQSTPPTTPQNSSSTPSLHHPPH
uniref:Galectin 17 n=1 Tax=Electrophorus electricus TaxID=8005 RepID=A0A4W4E5H2_ELEEL